MDPRPAKVGRPIRVVMFGSGPQLNPDVELFLSRLENHPQIDLLGAFCQGSSQSWGAVVKDLWQRRGILAPALLLARIGDVAGRYLANPRQTREKNQIMDQIFGRIHFVPDIHDTQVLEAIKSMSPDLGLIYGSPILKPELFEVPLLGTLGIHHGKVPEYRGNKTMFWAMHNGERTAGVTIQKVNVGLDTGQIVKQGEVVIGNRFPGAVWRDLEALGLDLYIQAILEVRRGTATYQPQIGPKGKLYRNPKPADIIQLWMKQLKKRF